jgi:hypothetical protein
VIEVSDYAIEAGRTALMAHFESAHDRLRVFSRVDDALRATAYSNCHMSVEVWSCLAHNALGMPLPATVEARLAPTRDMIARLDAIERGELVSLCGVSNALTRDTFESPFSALAQQLDRPAFALWRGADREMPFAAFRVKFHRANSSDAELVKVCSWAIKELLIAESWERPFSKPPAKGMQTRKRNAIVELMREAKRRVEIVSAARIEKGVETTAEKDLGAIVAAFMRVFDSPKQHDLFRAAPDLVLAIQSTEIWKNERCRQWR